jgi:hypothetical protein
VARLPPGTPGTGTIGWPGKMPGLNKTSFQNLY